MYSLSRTNLVLTVPAFFFLFFISCSQHPDPNKDIVAVGDNDMTLQDVTYRGAIQHAYGGDTMPVYTALVASVNDLLTLEVARRAGLEPTEADVKSYIAHVEKTTKAPDILQRVKDIFGSDTGSYVRLYLEPKIAETKLQNYQAFDTTVQDKAREQILDAYALVAKGASFADAASKAGGVSSVDTFDVEDGGTGATDPVQKNSSLHPLAVLARDHLQPGELFSQVIEDQYAYRLVRLIARRGGNNIVETVTVPKQGYDVWFKKQAETIPITIHDAALVDSIRKHHENVWWIEHLQ